MELALPKKIFIVDDDSMLTEALQDYITRKVQHEVRIFHTGEECLKYLHEKPEYVILDYNLNSVHKDAANGMQILETIKRHHPEIHVIMLSSQEKYLVALQSIQKGAEQYVIKDETAFEKISEIVN